MKIAYKDLRHCPAFGFAHHLFSQAVLGIHINLGIRGAFFVEQAICHDAIGANVGRVDQYLRHVFLMFVTIELCSLKVQGERFKAKDKRQKAKGGNNTLTCIFTLCLSPCTFTLIYF